ncbi:MAG: class I SAM-dependent methyltransferase [Planctomycetales bacterium]|nr:class I SAM-dependent methyltransferase [Planctomycetales bacterium]
MISPKLYRKSRTYDFFMKSFGYSRSIERFLCGLKLDLPSRGRILDAGCGTGILGIHFLERFGDATLLATDLEPNFLQATLSNAELRGIAKDRITVAIADISAPRQVTSLEGESRVLDKASFDLICIGAVIGYAKDTEASIRELVSMITPGGYFVNLEMNDSPTGRFVSHRYHYHNIPLSRMQSVIREEGCEVTVTGLGMQHLPAKLTRTAFIARKIDS